LGEIETFLGGSQRERRLGSPELVAGGDSVFGPELSGKAPQAAPEQVHRHHGDPIPQ
jgi:hypothetical protein